MYVLYDIGILLQVSLYGVGKSIPTYNTYCIYTYAVVYIVPTRRIYMGFNGGGGLGVIPVACKCDYRPPQLRRTNNRKQIIFWHSEKKLRFNNTHMHTLSHYTVYVFGLFFLLLLLQPTTCVRQPVRPVSCYIMLL